MAKLVWDKSGEHRYEAGVDQVILFTMGANNAYNNGVAWNGVTNVTKTPSGGDANDFYADNIKYLTLRGAESIGGSIAAYDYPDEWEECDGSAEIADGVYIGQQTRKVFAIAYRTMKGNDTLATDYGYKWNIIYNATSSPSERAFDTINESPEPLSMSWEFSATAVPVTGHKPSATLEIDSTKVSADKMKLVEEKLLGTDSAESTLPSIDEFISMLSA